MKNYIYLVGEADPQAVIVETVKRLGYSVGLFVDVHRSIKQPEIYDNIMQLDFAHLDNELSKLHKHDLGIVGLLSNYENYIIAKAKLGSHFNLPALSIETAQLCTDKYTMRQAFARYDSRITPAFAAVSDEKAARGFAKEHGYPVILKPRNLVKSLLVLRCNDGQELHDNLAYIQANIARLYDKYRIYDHKPEIIIETFITGTLCTVAAFIDGSGTPYICDGIAAVTTAQQLGIDDNYLYARSLPADLTDDLRHTILTVAIAATKALKMQATAAHIELIYTPDGSVKVIEVGARIGGYRPRMYRLSYGLDLYAADIAVATGQTPVLHGRCSAYTATYELFPSTEGRFAAISAKAGKALPDSSLFSYYAIKAQLGTVIGPAKHGFKAAAIIIVSHPNRAEFLRRCQLVDTLQVSVE